MCRQLPPARLRLGGRPYTLVPNSCNESGWEEDEDVFMASAMLSRRSRWWGDRDNDNGKEDKVEEDDNCITITVLGVAAGKMTDLRSPQGGRQRRCDGGGQGIR